MSTNTIVAALLAKHGNPADALTAFKQAAEMLQKSERYDVNAVKTEIVCHLKNHAYSAGSAALVGIVAARLGVMPQAIAGKVEEALSDGSTFTRLLAGTSDVGRVIGQKNSGGKGDIYAGYALHQRAAEIRELVANEEKKSAAKVKARRDSAQAALAKAMARMAKFASSEG